MRPRTTLRTLATLQQQVERYQAALQQIAELRTAMKAPEEEEYDDTESAYSNGMDVGTVRAETYQQVAQIAREALK